MNFFPVAVEEILVQGAQLSVHGVSIPALISGIHESIHVSATPEPPAAMRVIRGFHGEA